MLHFPLITVNAIRKDNGMQNRNKTQDLVILTHLANYLWRHSRQKWKYSLETWAVYREIFRVSWNLPNDPKHRGLFLKNKTSSEGYQLLEWAFMLLWIKYRLITSNWKEVELNMNLHTSSIYLEKKPLHKKWSFPLRISPVNVTKFVVSCGFGHIYWRNP